MPLLSLWKSSPETIAKMSLEQIVNIAGDGKLRDNSETSTELRAYFNQVPTQKLGDYALFCLSHPFQQSGFVLQDIMNELGRRLEYNVANGLYSGTKYAIGFDGIWTLSEGHSIVVEVKTTDAYRINLDTIANYRNRLFKEGSISEDSSSLIIVGRQDTGDIEAQIRGSRHAWAMRMISAEALIKLVTLKEASEDEETLNKIRSLLIPFEYTRLDNIIDIVFATATDTHSIEENPHEIYTNSQEESKPIISQNKQNRTDVQIINSIRFSIVSNFGKEKLKPLLAKSKAMYWSGDRKLRIACTISKPYSKGSDYWYAFHKKWLDFLSEGEDTYYVVGFVDSNKYIAIPTNAISSYTENFYKTTQHGNLYWHILINKTHNGYSLIVPGRDNVDLSPFIMGNF